MKPRLSWRGPAKIYPTNRRQYNSVWSFFPWGPKPNMAVLAKPVKFTRQTDWRQQQITAEQSVKQWIGSSWTFLSSNCNWFQTTVACDQSQAIGCASGRVAVMCGWWKCSCALATSVSLSLGNKSRKLCTQLCTVCAPYPIAVLSPVSASSFLIQLDLLRWTGPSKICICDGTTKINNVLCESVFFNCTVKGMASYFRFLSADWVSMQSFFLDTFHGSQTGIFSHVSVRCLGTWREKRGFRQVFRPFFSGLSSNNFVAVTSGFVRTKESF
jgi:hypothetical protein